MARKVSTKAGDVSLSKSIDCRLKFYGMAAAAASVGLLALVEPAEGKVVITNPPQTTSPRPTGNEAARIARGWACSRSAPTRCHFGVVTT